MQLQYRTDSDNMKEIILLIPCFDLPFKKLMKDESITGQHQGL